MHQKYSENVLGTSVFTTWIKHITFNDIGFIYFCFLRNRDSDYLESFAHHQIAVLFLCFQRHFPPEGGDVLPTLVFISSPNRYVGTYGFVCVKIFQAYIML